MANEWKVKFTDDDEDGIQIASFNSSKEANDWIKNQEIQGRYDPCNFEVVEGPYKDVSMVKESKQKFDPTSYVTEFREYFGYRDDYEVKKDYNEAYDSLAREIALQMPTDTAAQETEGDAVMLLVQSGDEEAIEAGKALGDCMMRKTKHDKKTLLSKMREAFLALGHLNAQQQAINESITKDKLWVDDVRPAPSGYIWLKSVNGFIDYMVEHGLDNVLVVDIDHDAGDYASDGGDYIKCLDWLESMGVEDINIRIHSANPVGVAKMRQVIAKNGWREVFDIYESTLSKDEQLQLLFESIGPSDYTFGEKLEELDKKHPAYSTVADSMKDREGLRLEDVCKVEGKDHFIATLHGGDNGSLDQQKWLRYLEQVKKIIAQMFNHGCGDVWLVDFNNDYAGDAFTLRVGFQLLSSPFSSDENKPIEEVEELDEAGISDKSLKDPNKKKGSGQKDSATKDKIVDKLRDLAGEFKSKASNNDPEQFAKIKVAFDDLASAVGDYDFKQKRILKEFDADGLEEESQDGLR